MDIQFIYDVVESKYSNLECYMIYDFKDNEPVHDFKLKKSLIMIDKPKKLIYFMNMETGNHYIIEKLYYYKIIQMFLNDAENYDCKGFTVYPDCSGGEIYYKYNK